MRSLAGPGEGNEDLAPPLKDYRRVVSLVPSLTETFFDLGLGDRIVGITDYCIYPSGSLARIPRLGGPKSIDIDRLVELKPDLVIANQEENTKAQIEQLEKANLQVLLTFPTTVQETIEMVWDLAHAFRSESAAERVNILEITLEWMRAAAVDKTPVRYFCPIWQGETQTGQPWWMTFNEQTYSSDLLRLLGGENVFAGRLRKYPLEADLDLRDPEPAGERDQRYPRVSREEIIRSDPQVVIFPSEPYEYSQADIERFAAAFPDLKAVQDNRLVLLDGTLITWCGTRLARAIQELPGLFSGSP